MIALPCDHFHHHYHYQSSLQYLWLAETLMRLERKDEAANAYDQAIFQDHFNEDAVAGRRDLHEGKAHIAYAPAYDKHPLLDREFCLRVGRSTGAASTHHDSAVKALACENFTEAFIRLEHAFAADPEHSNSYFVRGKCFFLQSDLPKAHSDFVQAILLSHRDHDVYHRTAASEHLARGLEFLDAQETDLAVRDFTRALDLHAGNREARTARARAYRMKGNIRLAEEDERILSRAGEELL